MKLTELDIKAAITLRKLKLYPIKNARYYDRPNRGTHLHRATIVQTKWKLEDECEAKWAEYFDDDHDNWFVCIINKVYPIRGDEKWYRVKCLTGESWDVIECYIRKIKI